MKKISLIFSCLSILIGVSVFILTSILNQIIPKLGRIAYQAAVLGSYSPEDYKMNFTLTNIIAAALVFTGFAIIANIYNNSNNNDEL